MRGVGQPVDHRHGRMARELVQLSRLVGADHDRVDIARQHARGVGHGLAAPELTVGGVEKDRVAAEMAHRHLERHAGPRRRLLEDHRQGLAGERPVAPAMLVGEAEIEDPAQRGGCRTGRGRENGAAARAACPARRSAPLRARGFSCRPLRGHLVHDAERLVDFALADDQRRQQCAAHSRRPSGSRGHSGAAWRRKSAAGTTQRMPSSRPEPRSSANSFG